MKMAFFGVKSHACTHFFGGTCTVGVIEVACIRHKVSENERAAVWLRNNSGIHLYS